MKLTEAIDLFRRRTYGMCLDEIVEATVTLNAGRASYRVVVEDSTARWKVSEVFQRLFAGDDADVHVINRCMYVPALCDYTLIGGK